MLLQRSVANLLSRSASLPHPSSLCRGYHATRPLLSTQSAASSMQVKDPRRREVARIPVALFPTVLFPGVRQPLQVDEPRYKIMVDEVMKQQPTHFGHVVDTGKLTEEEVSRPSSKVKLRTSWTGENVGTLVNILSRQELPDGRELVEVEGVRRFRIMHKERNLFGYWDANVEYLEEHVGEEDIYPVQQSQVRSLASEAEVLFKKCVDGPHYDPPKHVPIMTSDLLSNLTASAEINDDMATFSYRLASLLPANEQIRQELLCSPSTKQRLERSIDLLKQVLSKPLPEHAERETASSTASPAATPPSTSSPAKRE